MSLKSLPKKVTEVFQDPEIRAKNGDLASRLHSITAQIETNQIHPEVDAYHPFYRVELGHEVT